MRFSGFHTGAGYPTLGQSGTPTYPKGKKKTKKVKLKSNLPSLRIDDKEFRLTSPSQAPERKN